MNQKLGDLREDNDLTQKYIAEILGISQGTYSRYESGILDMPTDILIKLSAFYHVSIDYLLGVTQNPERNE